MAQEELSLMQANSTSQDLTDTIALQQEQQGYAPLDRDAVIAAIRSALKRRSGKTWSVTGGRGTGWGWITIDAPPKRRTGHHVDTGQRDEYGHKVYEMRDTGDLGGYMTPADAMELATLMGLESVHHQGHMIPASLDYRIEAVAQAEGRNPSTHGVPYWD